MAETLTKTADMNGGKRDLAVYPMDPYGGEMQTAPPDGRGCCDDLSSIKALETNYSVLRYATGFVDLVLDSGNMVIAKTGNSPLILWDKGVKETGDSAGLRPTGTALTRAETDAFADGVLTTTNATDFRIVGLAVEFELPFVTATVGGDPAARRYLPALDLYFERVVRALAIATHLKFKHGDSEFGFEMGRPSFWPSMSAKVGQVGAQFGSPMAGAFIPLRVPGWAGRHDDDRALEVELHVDRTVQLDADTSTPIPALASGAHYLLPVTVQLIGHPVRGAGSVRTDDVAKVMGDLFGQAMANANGDPTRFLGELQKLLPR